MYPLIQMVYNKGMNMININKTKTLPIIALLCSSILAGESTSVSAMSLDASQGGYIQKNGDWSSIQHVKTMTPGKPFTFQLKCHESKKGLKLISALHWFNEKKVYGGLLKNYKSIKNPVKNETYQQETTFHFLPEEAKFFVVVSHLSPTGGWKDKVAKFSSQMIPRAPSQD
jgi:hypothetical protein